MKLTQVSVKILKTRRLSYCLSVRTSLRPIIAMTLKWRAPWKSIGRARRVLSLSSCTPVTGKTHLLEDYGQRPPTANPFPCSPINMRPLRSLQKISAKRRASFLPRLHPRPLDHQVVSSEPLLSLVSAPVIFGSNEVFPTMNTINFARTRLSTLRATLRGH